MFSFSYLIEDAHGQHRQGCVYNIVKSDEVLVVDSLKKIKKHIQGYDITSCMRHFFEPKNKSYLR